MEELSQDNLDKTTKEANLNKLRDEFNKKRFNNQNHPKTSHIHKNSMAHSSLNFNISKKYPRTNKALSAYSFNQKVGNVYKLNDKQYLDFYKKHPGYLYYKEIIASMKSKQLNINKKRAFTGKNLNKKIKFGNTNYNYSNKKKEKFPKIDKNKRKNKYNYVNNYIYNFNCNNFNYNQNHNYNFNINNININIRDKKNPYSISWVSKILNQNDYNLKIKEKYNGVPRLIPLMKKDENIHKIYNSKLFLNNYIQKEKSKREDKYDKNEKQEKDIKEEEKKKISIDKQEETKEQEKEEIKKEEEKKEEKDEKNNNDNDDLDEEQQMQFYKNQKNFFKVRKDIKEEPEDQEEDKDEDKEKDKNDKENNINDNVNNEVKENPV